jgi:hypothetical protein
MESPIDISTPNAHGVLDEGRREIVARPGRAYAAVNVAWCDDGLYRSSVELHYSYGGFSGPIVEGDPGYPTFDAAKTAGLEELLRRWHKPFSSDPQSVREELRILREQIESRLRQPCLF